MDQSLASFHHRVARKFSGKGPGSSMGSGFTQRWRKPSEQQSSPEQTAGPLQQSACFGPLRQADRLPGIPSLCRISPLQVAELRSQYTSGWDFYPMLTMCHWSGGQLHTYIHAYIHQKSFCQIRAVSLYLSGSVPQGEGQRLRDPLTESTSVIMM